MSLKELDDEQASDSRESSAFCGDQTEIFPEFLGLAMTLFHGPMHREKQVRQLVTGWING